MSAFGAAAALPNNGTLWLVSRLLLDGAGALFGLYLLTALGLSTAGRLMRLRRRGIADDAGVDRPAIAHDKGSARL